MRESRGMRMSHFDGLFVLIKAEELSLFWSVEKRRPAQRRELQTFLQKNLNVGVEQLQL